jgi:hypothetical protein
VPPGLQSYLTMHTLEDGRGGWTACTTLNQCNPFPKSDVLQVVIQSSSVKVGLGGTKQSSHHIIISGTNVDGIWPGSSTMEFLHDSPSTLMCGSMVNVDP